jgi:hypothetical protein
MSERETWTSFLSLQTDVRAQRSCERVTNYCWHQRQCGGVHLGQCQRLGDREWSLNEGQIPNCRGIRVHASTGYNRVEGNRRASRNGRVSDLHRKSLPLRFATFASLYACRLSASAHRLPRPRGHSSAIPPHTAPLPLPPLHVISPPLTRSRRPAARTTAPSHPRPTILFRVVQGRAAGGGGEPGVGGPAAQGAAGVRPQRAGRAGRRVRQGAAHGARAAAGQPAAAPPPGAPHRPVR